MACVNTWCQHMLAQLIYNSTPCDPGWPQRQTPWLYDNKKNVQSAAMTSPWAAQVAPPSVQQIVCFMLLQQLVYVCRAVGKAG
jgi:hypothetical protein